METKNEARVAESKKKLKFKISNSLNRYTIISIRKNLRNKTDFISCVKSA